MIAASLLIGAHIATHHFDEQFSGMQGNNPGLYARLENGITVGGYRNSFGRASFYAGYTWQTQDGRFALTAGGLTGYAMSKVAPMVTPSARVELWDGLAARITYVPRVPRVGAAHGVHFSVERGW